MRWETAWSYRPIDYNTTIGEIRNITQRTYFMNNLTGDKARLKFSNRYGTEPILLENVTLGQRKGTEIQSFVPVTYKKNRVITIGPGEEFYSDEITVDIKAGMELVLSIYVKNAVKIQSACSTWNAQSWNTVYGLDGDYTVQQEFDGKQSLEVYPYVDADVNKANIIFGVCGIEVFAQNKVNTITLFGDSITHMSYFADALCEKLYSNYPGEVTVINRGIGGNRLLHDATYVKEMDGNGRCFGEAGSKRFEKDVFESNVPDTVILLEGVNDMMHPYIFKNEEEIVTADDLIKGAEKLIELTHEKGAKIYLGTVMPFRNDEMEWLPEAEEVRQRYNEWIRNQEISDGIIDFDGTLRDENRTEYLQDGTHIGDGLHPNKMGGQLMASLVPVEKMIRKEEM